MKNYKSIQTIISTLNFFIGINYQYCWCFPLFGCYLSFDSSLFDSRRGKNFNSLSRFIWPISFDRVGWCFQSINPLWLVMLNLLIRKNSEQVNHPPTFFYLELGRWYFNLFILHFWEVVYTLKLLLLNCCFIYFSFLHGKDCYLDGDKKFQLLMMQYLIVFYCLYILLVKFVHLYFF